MKPWIRKTHRWLGLLFSLTLLMSSGSGVIHTLMSRSQPPPPQAKPGAARLDTSAIRISAAEAVAALPVGEVAGAINLRTIAGQPCWQIFTGKGPARYVNAATGASDAAMDEVYADEIASAFLSGAAVKKAGYLTAFDDEYIPIFRLLPVYRFDADDGRGTRVYVSTLTGSVTRHTDDGRQFEANLFTRFHKFGFIPNKDLRDGLLTAVTGGVFVVSVLGIVLFFLTRPRRKR